MVTKTQHIPATLIGRQEVLIRKPQRRTVICALQKYGNALSFIGVAAAFQPIQNGQHPVLTRFISQVMVEI